MIFQGISFARLLTTTQSDYDFYNKKYENTGVVIEFCDFKSLKFSELPSILIGKSFSSILEPSEYGIVAIVDSIKKNEKKSEQDVSFYLERISYEYNPYDFVSYDSVLDGDLYDFILSEVEAINDLFLFFQKKCLYIYCSGKVIAISLESLQYVNESFKDSIDKILLTQNCYIFSFNNFKKYITNVEDHSLVTFENIVWCKEQIEISEKDLFQHFGDVQIYRNIPYLMSVYLKQNPLSDAEVFSIKRYYRKDLITHWMSNQDIFFNQNVENLNLKKSGNLFCIKLNYSDKRTITGRINCFDDFLNIQTLPKKSELRNHIVSRYKNGQIVVFDYVSFEPRIATFATLNLEFIENLKNKDIHNYVSQIVFKKEIISKEERSIGKLFNHTLLFGGGEEKLKSIIRTSIDVSNEEFELIYNSIKTQLSPIISLSESIIQIQKEYGYITNPYGVIIKPRKNYAAFNNFIQSTAADIVVEKLFEIRKFISDKKIKFLYQVYDSFIFDFDSQELTLIPEIKQILSVSNKVEFLVDYKMGKNLMDCDLPEYEDVEFLK